LRPTSKVEVSIFFVELNHILLFLAVATPLLVLARAWRPGGIFRGWRIAAIIVLAITGLTWLFLRDYAGYVGGGAWFALLFLPMLGLRRASELAAQRRYQKAIRLTRALQVLHPTAQLREQLDIFRKLEARNLPAPESESESLPDSIFRRLRSAPAVIVIILLNVAMFGVELWRGALDNPTVLHRLGELDINEIVNDGEFWRLLTALFLHVGPLHLIVNLLGLYVIGPPLEQVLGTIRFGMCYLISGIGSTVGVAALTLTGILQPARLVGASGCIMGIVGVWAGFLLRHRHTWQARQRLLNILMIIVVQVVFDVLTPQVSTSAHLCGLVAGFIIGLGVQPKRGAF
jgi:membrane associated rhomboid family serine protease